MPTPVVISGGQPVRVAPSPYADLREAVTSVTRALEDTRYTSLSDAANEQRGDAPYPERKELIERSRMFCRRSPLAKQATKLLINYVIGQGITLRANDKEHVARLIDEFWEDPVNRSVLTGHTALGDALRTIFTDGNLFIVLFPNKEEGTLRLGVLDALYVEDIVSDPDNWKVAKWYKVSRPSGAYDFDTGQWVPDGRQEFVWYRDWRNDDDLPDPPSEDTGRRRRGRKAKNTAGPTKVEEGLVYHVAINRRGLFGEPEPAAALDWLKAHKDFMESRATINEAAARIAWRKKQKGSVGSVAAAAEQLRSHLTARGQGWDTNPPPAPGATIVENENSTMEWVKTDTGGAASDYDERKLRMMVGSAFGGIPNHIFGDEAQANLATATAMNTPMQRMYAQWQKLCADMLSDIIGFLLSCAHEAGNLGPRDDSSKYGGNKTHDNAHNVLDSPSAQTGRIAAGGKPAPVAAGRPGAGMLEAGFMEHGSKGAPGYEKLHPNTAGPTTAQPQQRPVSPMGFPLPEGWSPDDPRLIPTDKRFVDDQGNWLPERKAIHEEYVRDVQKNAVTTSEPIIYMTGGGPASGKGTFLKEAEKYGLPDKDTGGVAYINADEARARLPEYKELLDAGYAGASSTVHEEASDMSKTALYESLRNGHSSIYDAVGDSGIESLHSKVEKMRAAADPDGTGQGYEPRVFADYMTVPVHIAIQRAAERARTSADPADRGRTVPTAVLRAMHADIPHTVQAAIERKTFDRLRVWDSNVPLGTPARLMATYTREQGLQVNDEGLWSQFTASPSRYVEPREHGSPEQADYYTSKHPKKINLSATGDWWEGPLHGGLGGKVERADAAPDAAATIRRKQATFAQQGGRIHKAQGMVDAELAYMRVIDMERAMPDGWGDDLGVNFTRQALDSGRHGGDVLIAHDGDGIAGALAYVTEPGYLGINWLGTTGITEGTGSALTAMALRTAVQKGVGIRLDSVRQSKGFWRAVGFHDVDAFEKGQPPMMGLSASEVRALAGALNDA